MHLRNLQNNLVHGALIDAEILTSPLPHVFAQPGQVFGHWHSACRCATTSQVIWKLQSSLKIFLCVSATSKKTWCMRPYNVEILQVYLSEPNDFPSPCVSETCSIKFGAWGPNRCWDIYILTPPGICSSWPSYPVPMLHPQVCQHLPSGLKRFLCVSETSKKFVAWGPNR